MIKKIKGTNDILPGSFVNDIFSTDLWLEVESVIRDTADSYGYSEIRTPIFESTELFVRGLGDVTDIVQKEMFSFTDRGERELTLRPEGTASIVRAYLENSINKKEAISRYYYMGPMFRAERPQKGRYRQFHQFGIECIGMKDPVYDVEVIALFWTILKKLNLNNIELSINSVGCPKCRSDYQDKLKTFFKDKLSMLCKDCNERYEKNILRILDCKVEECQSILEKTPSAFDYLCEECRDSYINVKSELTNLEIPFKENPRLVRGLDYYTKTAFEIIHKGIGAQAAIVGGGRYDDLIGSLSSSNVPAVGAAFGIERLLLSLLSEEKNISKKKNPFYFLVLIDEESIQEYRKIIYNLRQNNIITWMSDGSKQIGKQLKAADKANADYAVFIGGEEWEKNKILIKNLKNKTQLELQCEEKNAADVLTDFYKKQLK